MSFVFRSITADELPAFANASSTGFGESNAWFERERPWAASSIERTIGGFEGNSVVSTSRNFPFDMTVPGGASLHTAGVSAVTVLPTHRRRGLFREMMTRLLADAVEHEEPVSILTASEASIYGRFGYGPSALAGSVRIAKHELEFSQPRPAGRLRLIDVDEARKVEPDVFERLRLVSPGAVSRPDLWWYHHYEPSFGTRFDVIYESPSGSIDGYVTYSVRDKWGPAGAAHVLAIRELIGCTPDAEHALWRYLAEVDLVQTITSHSVPLDTPLTWLLTSLRAAGIGTIHDNLWTRLLDVPAALGARTYAVPGRLVRAINDPVRPGEAADGTFALDGGPDGATVSRADTEPDLVCDVAVASTAWLGGVRWSQLAAAGLVEERSSGALATAEAMFASTPLPYGYTWF